MAGTRRKKRTSDKQPPGHVAAARPKRAKGNAGGAPLSSGTPRDAEAQWSLWKRRPARPLQNADAGRVSPVPAIEPPAGSKPPAPAKRQRARTKRMPTAAPALGVLAIHGVGPGSGQSRAGFSRRLRDLAFPDVAQIGPLWHECVWEDLHDGLDACVSGIVDRMAHGPVFDGLLRKSKGLTRIFRWVGGSAGADKILGTLEGLTRDVAARFVAKALDVSLDFWLYLDSAHGRLLRERLRKRLESVAAKHPRGVVLLGHSLGSVIAYDLLAEARLAGETLPVAAFATIGSPLAWAFDIRRADNRPEAAFDSIGPVPWTNFYYPEDYIALYSPLPADRFPSARNVRLSLPPKVPPLDAHRAYWGDSVLARCIRSIAMSAPLSAPITRKTP